MSSIKERAAEIRQQAETLNKDVYAPEKAEGKNPEFRMDLQSKSPKLTTLDEAIRRSGLRDGMTI